MNIEEWKGAELLLNGYSTRGKTIKRSYDGKVYEIEQYQGVHANEYCIYEVKNGVRDGTAELFDDGMVKMRWTMKQGVRSGSYVLFEKGVVVREGSWNDVGNNEEIVFENRRSQRTMVIRFNGEKVYEGGFNDKMERSELGYEYENGKLKWFGEWKNNSLVELKQRFVDDEEMIEYAQGSATDLLSRKPIYIGGYQLDEKSGLMKRNGRGRVLNEWTGVCVYEGEWKMGVEIDDSYLNLHDGWYSDHTSGVSTRMATWSNVTLVMMPSSLLETPQTVTEVTIGNSQFNDKCITTFKLSNLPLLKTIIIGNACFRNTRLVSLNYLPSLENLTIGEKCFALSDAYEDLRKMNRTDGLCEVTNCSNLTLIQFGNSSFVDFHTMTLHDLPSLQLLKVGVYGFYNAPLFSLSSCHG